MLVPTQVVVLVCNRLRARLVPTEPSGGTDTARIVVVFYTSNHHQEAFRSEMSLNERALKG